MVINPDHPFDVTVHVFHTDHIAKKEMCIGTATIPFEFILRPSQDTQTVWLAPPERALPGKYHMVLSGAIRFEVNVGGAEALNSPSWSARLAGRGGTGAGAGAGAPQQRQSQQQLRPSNPLSAFEVRDICTYDGRRKGMLDGPQLSEQDVLWFGSAQDLNRVSIIGARPHWVLLPVRDLYVKMSGVDIGSIKPGERFCFALERTPTHVCDSDLKMLSTVHESVQRSVVQLRYLQADFNNCNPIYPYSYPILTVHGTIASDMT
jgi:hypothetical protein